LKTPSGGPAGPLGPASGDQASRLEALQCRVELALGYAPQPREVRSKAPLELITVGRLNGEESQERELRGEGAGCGAAFGLGVVQGSACAPPAWRQMRQNGLIGSGGPRSAFQPARGSERADLLARRW
jgi:hypothetical protein